jgi:diadenosine tetraphosphatase ApaH/serine/threonine PP2A family protein phosphatase
MDLDVFIEELRTRQTLLEADLTSLFYKAQDILYQESTLLRLSAPITVCGDVHGQFYDVLHLFEVGGPPGGTRYLFLGDYVDRGYHSIETFALLLAYKVKYPNSFYLLRGNHECRQVNQMYGFYEECISRFGHAGPYKMCNEIFDMLPIAALINRAIYCVHGGLSPGIRAVEQVCLLERRAEIPNTGPISDICWSDPEDIVGWGVSQRGAGYLFGSTPTAEFVHNNRLELIARAHQLAMQGFQYHFPERPVVTIWSAPNYMYRSKNLASVMTVSERLEREFCVFEAVADQKRISPDIEMPSYFQ